MATLCPARSVFEVIDQEAANDAGITARFQCQDCGQVLGSPDEPHEGA